VFLLRHASHNLKQSIIIKWLREILHENIAIQFGIQHPQPHKLIALQQIGQRAYNMIHQSLYRIINPQLVIVVRFASIALDKHKLGCWHRNSSHLDSSETTWHCILWVVR
jgi:hypothetical protein